jgi:HAD superfamily hydrolase (TIGR01549 family)
MTSARLTRPLPVALEVTLRNCSGPIIGDNGSVAEPVPAPQPIDVQVDLPQLVLFDLDGTLTDSADGIVASFRHALAAVGCLSPDLDDEALTRRIVGPPMARTLESMLGGQAEAALAAYRADYTTRGWSMNNVFDGIEDLLKDLHTRGVRLAVATSKNEVTARRILEHFGLDGYFEVIAGASSDGTRAEKADVVAHALAQLSPLPERVLMVGDRRHDVEGAAAHGIDTVVVGWGYGGSDFTETDLVATHVTDVAALREVLGA